MKFSTQARSRARRYAMQALYQWDLSGLNLGEIKRQFFEGGDFSKADAGYFSELLDGIDRYIERIDGNLSEATDRPIERVDPVERSILRIACYELLFRHDIPYRVSINEAVLLAKKFGAVKGHAFVNGVLDKLARKLRPGESAGTEEQVTGG